MIASSPPAVAIRGLTKRFVGTLALDRVDLTIERGEIHALVGENGAGKSTLIKILAGINQADEGEILIDGAALQPHADSVPISFVHQDLGLVDELSIGENVALVAGFPRTGGFISWRRVWDQAREIYDVMGVEPPDPMAPVSSLGAANKAVLGIVRALSRKSRIVVLDEPTASLPGQDAQHLFDILKRLRQGGTSILYVSHRLNELFGLADQVTVFRDGRHVRTSNIADLTPDAIVRDMLGKELEIQHNIVHEAGVRAPLLEVSDLRTGNQGPLSFTIGAGEVVGLIGLRGAGHEDIGRAIFGTERQLAGQVTLAGEPLDPDLTIAQRIAKGVALLAGNRLQESAVTGMSLLENLFPNAAGLARGHFRPIPIEQESRRAGELMEQLDVRPRNSAAPIDSLSGGNQQKVFVGRWLVNKARLYVMEEPTAGVDVGAKGVIHRILRAIAAEGAGVLVVSSDFEEVASLCDRAIVVNRGVIAAELSGKALTADALIARSSLGADAGRKVH
jgi:ribose transport system ATP-binding protein